MVVTSTQTSGLAIGIALGVALGVSTDNLGLWLPTGVALGLTVFSQFGRKDEGAEDSATGDAESEPEEPLGEPEGAE